MLSLLCFLFCNLVHTVQRSVFRQCVHCREVVLLHRSLGRLAEHLGLPLNSPAPLTWYFARKEKERDTETNLGIPRRRGAYRVDEQAVA